MSEIKYRGFVIEMRALWSNERSYFSKKRIESTFIFLSVLVTYIWFCALNLDIISAIDFTIVSGAMMVYGGYTVNSIQKEKKINKEL
jgi:hypothetical protein